jgi:hypothetical protein
MPALFANVQLAPHAPSNVMCLQVPPTTTGEVLAYAEQLVARGGSRESGSVPPRGRGLPGRRTGACGLPAVAHRRRHRRRVGPLAPQARGRWCEPPGERPFRDAPESGCRPASSPPTHDPRCEPRYLKILAQDRRSRAILKGRAVPLNKGGPRTLY